MAAVNFPSDLAPSSRTFTVGDYPQNVFEAENGAKSVIRYGNKPVDAKLTLGFTNITDTQANAVISNYVDVNSDWNYIVFSASQGLQGIELEALRSRIIDGVSGSLRWRYSDPPSITSVQPGINNVTCSFVACLDGD